jgi:hypothetical protein
MDLVTWLVLRRDCGSVMAESYFFVFMWRVISSWKNLKSYYHVESRNDITV